MLVNLVDKYPDLQSIFVSFVHTRAKLSSQLLLKVVAERIAIDESLTTSLA